MSSQILFVHQRVQVCRAALAAFTQAGITADAREWLSAEAAPSAKSCPELIIVDPKVTPGIDWLLDRFRTATNAFGDAVGSAIVDKAFDAEAPDPASAS